MRYDVGRGRRRGGRPERGARARAGRGDGSPWSMPGRPATLRRRTCRASCPETGCRRPTSWPPAGPRSRATASSWSRIGSSAIEPGFVGPPGRRPSAGSATDPRRDRRPRRAAGHPRCPRALGPGSAALPVLPRLGGPRPADRRPGHETGRRPARPARAPVVGRRRLLRPHPGPRRRTSSRSCEARGVAGRAR